MLRVNYCQLLLMQVPFTSGSITQTATPPTPHPLPKKTNAEYSDILEDALFLGGGGCCMHR